jgi:hypothetical protein
MDELIASNPKFQALVAKSKTSARKPFVAGERGSTKRACRCNLGSRLRRQIQELSARQVQQIRIPAFSAGYFLLATD